MKSSAVMRPVRSGLAGVAALAVLLVAPMAAQVMPPPPKYPPAARGPQSDDVGGVRFADPYRWLENVGSAEVRAWAAAQSAVTESYLAELPRRREMRNLIAREWKYPDVSAPFGAGERLFFYAQNGRIDIQPVLYVRDRPESPPRVLIDPNVFSHDGLIAIVDQSPSPDGRFLAYAVALQGSAWRTVRIRDVRSGLDQAEELLGIRDSRLSWTHDERGFFYTRSNSTGSLVGSALAAPTGRDQIFYHRVGHPQADDQLVYDDARHPEWRLRADVSSDGEYLVIAASNGAHMQTRIYFIDLDAPKHPNLGAPIVKLFDTGDAEYEFVANDGPVFFIRTTKDAPRARLVAVDINSPDEAHWTTTVRETYDPLVAVRRLDDRFVAHRLHDAHSVLEVYTLSGAARGPIPLPGNGTVTEINARSNYRELYFRYSAFLQPPVVYRYDLETKIAATYTEAPADTSLLQYETTQLYFTSKDGTRVPMFLTARRGITLDGSHATLLTGTGSFGRAATPAFSPFIAAWLKLGGIYAVANVRGGGEYGRAWHVAAIGAQKQVAADDFIGAAQFLISQRYTRPSMLAVVGHGTAGLLAGIAITQHPELFAGAVLDAPLLDMARFNRFAIGGTWTPEFGSPDAPADLRALLEYSPLHNLRGNTRYPATLIVVGDHDEVATPAHAYKFAAALQAVQNGSVPALLLVESDVGFGPGTPATKQVALDGDRLAFLQSCLRGGR